jgi:hypothetical protein
MNAQRTEVVKLEYRLPSEPGNHFQAWQSNGTDRFPEDRAQQERRNRSEFAAKSAAGLIRRRPQQEMVA